MSLKLLLLCREKDKKRKSHSLCFIQSGRQREAVFLYSSLLNFSLVFCQGGRICVRNSRRGGVGFTLTDDRRVFAGPPKPPSLLLQCRLDSALLINGALLRHDAPFMFIGCSAVTELFGYTFTDRRDKSSCPSASLTHGPPTTVPVICPSGPAV